MKLKFNSYINLTSMNKLYLLYQYCHASVILRKLEEVYIFKHRLYIIALEHITTPKLIYHK